MKQIVFLIGMFIYTACSGPKTYYLDATAGDDSNSGTSPEKAWRTLTKANSLNLQPGEKLLLKKGETFPGELRITGKGVPQQLVSIDSYGTERRKPCIQGMDTSLYALCIYNSEYIEVKNLEVINTGKERLAGRTGVKIHLKNFGMARSILLQGLDIHDVNGSLIKQKGGGSGLLIVNEGKEIPSFFDGLTIEDCTVRRCERNAMIWSGYWHRDNWHPNLNVVVRNNLLEEVPGDGIVPIGCDGALIEYNIMRNCPDLLPESEAAAGIWPWSCDNTIIRFNEASHHKAPWDGQGYDSDYNCTNTCIEYNYSHDNEGGFLLICSAGDQTMPYSVGNRSTIVRGNVSINDGTRARTTRVGYFAPIIHVAGPTKDTHIYNNILHVNERLLPTDHKSFVSFTSWAGYPDSTFIVNNLFYVNGPCEFSENRATGTNFENNYYIGKIDSIPTDKGALFKNETYTSVIEKDLSGMTSLQPFLRKVEMAVGTIITVDKKAVDAFFRK